MFDSPAYVFPADTENYAGAVATDGLGAVTLCFADLTRPTPQRQPDLRAAVTPVVEMVPTHQNGRLWEWRRQVGAYLIAVGERLMTGPAVGATQRG
jgi:hypothetical protein